MPEGDTIRRAADTLRPFVEGAVIEVAERIERTPFEVDSLPGCEIAGVEARGKHLLLHLGDGRAVHSHLGMTGSWHLYEHDAAWRKPRHRAWLVLRVPRVDVVCFSPKILELLSPDALRRHTLLNRLGPDILSATFDERHALERLRRLDAKPVGEAILAQTALSGVGNVYKSEVLFLQRVDPFAPVGEFSDETLLAIIARVRSLAKRNLDGRPRRTRFRTDGGRKWVYDRLGEPCLECGTPIRMQRQGDLGRSTYWCPECQVLRS